MTIDHTHFFPLKTKMSSNKSDIPILPSQSYLTKQPTDSSNSSFVVTSDAFTPSTSCPNDSQTISSVEEDDDNEDSCDSCVCDYM
jgi:hypothetical protein